MMDLQRRTGPARRFFYSPTAADQSTAFLSGGQRGGREVKTLEPKQETRRAMAGEHIHLAEVDSTLSWAKLRFETLPDGAFITAGFQTAGRGRLGRKWFSPPGINLLCSFIMKQAENPFRATCAVSLAILKLLRTAVPAADFFIKWPNDVYSGRAKVAGVLCEGLLKQGKVSGVIAGAGINVNLSCAEAAGLDQEASSLRILAGKVFPLEKLSFQLEKLLNKCYIECLNSPEPLFEQWKSENRLTGRVLDFIRPDGTVLRGEFHSILEDGSLRVRTPHSADLLRFDCGDIRIGRDSIPDTGNKQRRERPHRNGNAGLEPAEDREKD